ncbi:aldose 1-epimerase family protein [Amnibacterium endophyticum]|uniref:Aldose 1-epimerase family protein n=1 Tax=Amnibacterium endophyticum TaxID=2109337 RepID=A0ABW4LGM8_9MICO
MGVPATGEQHVLTLGGVSATVTELGASLRRLRVGDLELIQQYPPDALPSGGSGLVLVPWPNRVRDGRWTLDGRTQQLDLTDPSKGNAIHGLLRNTGYRVTDRSDSAITLSARVFPQHGWPFHLETSVRYELTADGIAVTHGVRNDGDGVAPVGVGCHPYLCLGDVPMRDLVVTVSGDRMLETDDRSLPVREVAVEGRPQDLRGGASLADLRLDTAYTGLTIEDGRVRHRLSDPAGRTVELHADPAFAWAQVFTNDVYATEDGVIDAVAIEPMTCPPDALNSGEGLVHLQQDEQWVVDWGIRLLA